MPPNVHANSVAVTLMSAMGGKLTFGPCWRTRINRIALRRIACGGLFEGVLIAMLRRTAILPFVVPALLSGCDLTRPDQDNYILDAKGGGGVRGFVKVLSADFSASPNEGFVSMSKAGPTSLFTLHAHDVLIAVDPLADDRCNPNAPTQATYDSQQYIVDLVYRTKSQSLRDAAKRKLIAAAAKAGTPLSKFTECQN